MAFQGQVTGGLPNSARRRTVLWAALACFLSMQAASHAGEITGVIRTVGAQPAQVRVGYVALVQGGREITSMAGMTLGPGARSATCSTYKPRISTVRTNSQGACTFAHLALPPGEYVVWARCNESYLVWQKVRLAGPSDRKTTSLTYDPGAAGDLVLSVAGVPQPSIRIGPLSADGKPILGRVDVSGHAGWDVDFPNSPNLRLSDLRPGHYRVQLRSKTAMGSADGASWASLKEIGEWSVVVVAGKERAYRLR